MYLFTSWHRLSHGFRHTKYAKNLGTRMHDIEITACQSRTRARNPSVEGVRGSGSRLTACKSLRTMRAQPQRLTTLKIYFLLPTAQIRKLLRPLSPWNVASVKTKNNTQNSVTYREKQAIDDRRWEIKKLHLRFFKCPCILYADLFSTQRQPLL